MSAVRQQLLAREWAGEEPGRRITVQANHHCTMDVYIGETKADGQFKILETSPQVIGEPFVAETFLLGHSDEKSS